MMSDAGGLFDGFYSDWERETADEVYIDDEGDMVVGRRPDEGGMAAGLGPSEACDEASDDDGDDDYLDMTDDEIDAGLDSWTEDDQARWDSGERW